MFRLWFRCQCYPELPGQSRKASLPVPPLEVSPEGISGSALGGQCPSREGERQLSAHLLSSDGRNCLQAATRGLGVPSSPSDKICHQQQFTHIYLFSRANAEGTEEVFYMVARCRQLNLPRTGSVGGCVACSGLWRLRWHLFGCALEADDRPAR
jgi:hypothetical protein